ncbi:MAG: hypothetical protein M3R47_09290 [Chloroflexota bacterium]|nr:hypothetical protein [Chloroflexota bacterium]
MNDFESVLEESWSRMESGESLDEVLARHPEHGAQLGPLLQVASKLAGVNEVMPSPVFRSRTRTQLNIHMRENSQLKRVSPLFWRLTITLVTIVLAFVATGTAFAQRALPGDTFYGWKLRSESAWRVVSLDRLGTDLTLSNRRVNELVALSGDEIRRTGAVEDYQKLLIRFHEAADAKDQERILPVLRSQKESLSKAGVSIPELDSYIPKDEAGS